MLPLRTTAPRSARSPRAPLLALLALAALCPAACGNGGGGDAGGGGMDAGDGGRADAGDTSCATLAASYCQHLDQCSQGVGVTEQFGNMTACQMRVAQLCALRQSAPGAQVTPEKNVTCAATITASECPAFFAGRVPECAFAGALADGANCALDAQCQSAQCLIPFGALCGVCGQHQAGDPCDALNGCGPDLACSSTGRCRTPVFLGGSCGDDAPCDAGLSCVAGGDAGGGGTCTPLGTAVNAPCDPAGRAAPGCDHTRGLYCDALTMQCKPVTFVTAGSACSAAQGTFCVGGGACLPAAGGGGTVCMAPEADMGACDTQSGPGCATLSRCVGMVSDAGTSVAGTCQLPRPDNCR